MELVDWSCRAIREEKRGFIKHSTTPILTCLGLEHVGSSSIYRQQGHTLHRGARAYGQMRLAARKTRRAFIKGLSEARVL